MASYPSSEHYKMIEADLKEISSSFKYELNEFKSKNKTVNRNAVYINGTALSFVTAGLTNILSSFYFDSLLNKLINEITFTKNTLGI